LLVQASQARVGRKAENFSLAQLSMLDEHSETDISALEAELEKTLLTAPQATVKNQSVRHYRLTCLVQKSEWSLALLFAPIMAIRYFFSVRK